MTPRVLLIYNELDQTQPYVAALRSAGLEAILLDAKEPVTLEGADGLLLMGGCDVNPALFGEDPHPQTEDADTDRDRSECEAIAQAIDGDLPVFGICRGLQILNVQQGGTLTQHLEGTERHRRRTSDRSAPAHSVNIVPGTVLASIAGEQAEWQVNSRHHQGIAKLADGLRVSALDPEDGCVEAIERPDKRFVVAVQWHPENQGPVHAEQARLFEAFAEACRNKA